MEVLNNVFQTFIAEKNTVEQNTRLLRPRLPNYV